MAASRHARAAGGRVQAVFQCSGYREDRGATSVSRSLPWAVTPERAQEDRRLLHNDFEWCAPDTFNNSPRRSFGGWRGFVCCHEPRHRLRGRPELLS